MKVVTGTEMQKIDRKAILDFNIKGIKLMENAGKRVADEIVKDFPDEIKNGVAIFSGKGNNGGDGFVVAMLLADKKINTRVFLACRKEEVSGDAKISLNKLLKIKKHRKEIKEISSFKDAETLKEEVREFGLIVDGLLGTGFKGSATGLIGKIIDMINEMKKPVVSIDLPSGVNADTGQVIGSCIRADMTVTLGLPKTGLLLYPGINYAGEVKVVDIGIPEEAINKEKMGCNLSEVREIKELIPKRYSDVHKGTAGKVLVIAGSVGYTGAACLASLSCLRSGAGLVTLGVPSGLNDILEVKLTEVITVPLPETKSRALSHEAGKVILELSRGYDCMAIGPGIGKEKETFHLVWYLIEHSTVPMVLDADGINAISGNTDILKHKKHELVITPHPGEMARLIHLTIDDVQSNRIEIARNFAQRHKCTVVLKGAHTIISSADGVIAINPTGNAGMATAGSGDVLTGIISAFISAKLNGFNASVAGAYVHGLAGDFAKEEKGEFGLIASDILENIPRTILKVLE